MQAPLQAAWQALAAGAAGGLRAPQQAPSLLAGLAMLMALLAAPPGAQALPQHEPVPGGVAVIAVEPGAELRYQGRQLMALTQAGSRYAVVGISLGAQAGRHHITVGGKEVAFEVAPKAYETQRLSIPDRRKVNPLPRDMTRIRKERQQMDAAFKRFTPGPVQTRFILPVDGPVSSPFGKRRILNGQPRSPHSGLDLAAPEGTPIVAPARGQVVATGDYFFNGKTVILDHGQGLVTLYCHLHEIQVAVGDRLEAGEPLGQVGQTGRVTGPHLHWGVSLNNARVNPELFLSPGL